MNFKKFHYTSKSTLSHKTTFFISDLEKSCAEQFMAIWENKYVVLNDGNYTACGRLVGCKAHYDYNENTLKFSVSLQDVVSEEITNNIWINNIEELSHEQYALYEVKRQIEAFPWAEEYGSKLIRIGELLEWFDICNIVSKSKTNEKSN